MFVRVDAEIRFRSRTPDMVETVEHGSVQYFFGQAIRNVSW
jgi:hypothetical protein